MTLALEQAVDGRPRDVVVFVQRQRSRPRFFFGVWSSSADERTPSTDTARWRAFVDIAERFNGGVELSPAYELDDLKRVYPGRLPKQLGRGTLFLAEFPCTLG